MKDFKQWRENSFMQDPAADVDRYIIGLTNRLSLLRVDEVDGERRERLMALKDVVDRVLG